MHICIHASVHTLLSSACCNFSLIFAKSKTHSCTSFARRMSIDSLQYSLVGLDEGTDDVDMSNLAGSAAVSGVIAATLGSYIRTYICTYNILDVCFKIKAHTR